VAANNRFPAKNGGINRDAGQQLRLVATCHARSEARPVPMANPNAIGPPQGRTEAEDPVVATLGIQTPPLRLMINPTSAYARPPT
jgi:hypothetical protein